MLQLKSPIRNIHSNTFIKQKQNDAVVVVAAFKLTLFRCRLSFTFFFLSRYCFFFGLSLATLVIFVHVIHCSAYNCYYVDYSV